MLTYNESWGYRRLERIRNLMCILTDTPFPCPYGSYSLTQALLSAVPCRRALPCTIRISKPRVSSWLPSICRYCAAVCLWCM